MGDHACLCEEHLLFLRKLFLSQTCRAGFYILFRGESSLNLVGLTSELACLIAM